MLCRTLTGNLVARRRALMKFKHFQLINFVSGTTELGGQRQSTERRQANSKTNVLPMNILRRLCVVSSTVPRSEIEQRWKLKVRDELFISPEGHQQDRGCQLANDMTEKVFAAGFFHFVPQLLLRVGGGWIPEVFVQKLPYAMMMS